MQYTLLYPLSKLNFISTRLLSHTFKHIVWYLCQVCTHKTDLQCRWSILDDIQHLQRHGELFHQQFFCICCTSQVASERIFDSYNFNSLSSSILQIIQYSFKTSNIVHLVIFFTNNFLTIDSIVWTLDYFSTIMTVLLIFLK